jgi:hypothetical protein
MKTPEINPQYYFRQTTESTTMLTALSRKPAYLDCPACRIRALTVCTYQSGDKAQ